MKKLGKVELHLHLDGSLDLDTAYALAKSRNVIKDTMTFDEFKSRIRNNQIEFSNDGSVNYKTRSGAMNVSYNGRFILDGKPAEKEFDRYDSRFCKAKRKAETISVDSGKNRLFLDFKNAKRSFSDV